MEWHFAYFWEHAIERNQINKLNISKEILEKSISIPIWINKPIEQYKKIANILKKI